MYSCRTSIAASTSATARATCPISNPPRNAAPTASDTRASGPHQERALIGCRSARGPPSGLYARGKAVAGTAHRLDVGIAGVAFERLAETADVHIDGPLFQIDIASPDAIEQLFATVYTIGVQHEKFQQAVFSRPQCHGSASGADAVAGAIEHQLSLIHRLALVLTHSAAEQCVDARQQLTRRKRHGQGVVCTIHQTRHTRNPCDVRT